MSATPDVGVIVVAAGSSTRAGGGELKQFRWLAGKPMLLHSVRAFQERSDVGMVVCVLPKSAVGDPPPWLFQSDLERLLLSVGGRTRAESVRNGLEDLPAELSCVLVHDAARPLISQDVTERVIQQVRRGTAAVPALPVVDTVKEAGEDGRIVRTVDRARLWRAQTPQGFPRAMLESAFSTLGHSALDATDDATLCERMGLPVVLVAGSERSLKITTDEDFSRAEALASLSE